MLTFWQDLRYAARILVKNRGFTAVAVLTLALGIGANTAIFTVLNAVLLKPLPYPQPERIVQLGGSLKKGEPEGYVTGPQFSFLQEHPASTFDSIAAFQPGSLLQLKQQDQMSWLTSQRVTEDFFRVLGVSPALGRTFQSGDMKRGAPPAVVLSDTLWRNALGANANVIGTQIVLDDLLYTIVGVMPRSFTFVEQPADAYIPLQFSDSIGDQGMNTRMLARLKPDVTTAQSQIELNTLFEQFPSKDGKVFLGNYKRWLAGDSRASLLLLFGATGLLLLLACLNIANLQLSRGAFRRKEIFIRIAIGAGAGQLLRQFLAESFLLATAGALGGVLAAYWILAALVSSIPFNLDWAGPIRIDTGVLLFTLGIVLVTTVVFGLVSYWQAARGNPITTVGDEARQALRRASPGRVRNILATCEIALSLALLIGAALLGESLYRLYQEKLGFDPDNVVTMKTAAPRANPTPEQLWNSQKELLQKIENLPGVRSAAVVTVAPLTEQANLPAQAFGMDDEEHSFGGTEIRAISQDYFETMRIPILQGRRILQSDQATSAPVALVNETLARRWWRNGNPIGQRVVIGKFRGRNLFPNPTPREVVGVVEDVKGRLITRPAPPTLYIPASQRGDMLNGSTAWVVRTIGRVNVVPSLREAVKKFDPVQQLPEIRSMKDVVAASVAAPSFVSVLVSAFAGVALVLAAIGIYGVLSLFVVQRTHEIGIRMALGADQRQVLLLVVGQGLILGLSGGVIGVAMALGLSRFLSSLLYQIKPTNSLPYLVSAVVSVAAAVLASYVPARRAVRIDPLAALRHE
jgi:putative ABC transport system permease protein